MRDRTILLESFDEIKILQQFLYMDADNSVSMKNKLGVIVQCRGMEDFLGNRGATWFLRNFLGTGAAVPGVF